MKVTPLDQDERNCIIEALRSHREFLERSASARRGPADVPNMLADGLDKLAKQAQALETRFRCALGASLEEPTDV